jgi:hypothetical protein
VNADASEAITRKLPVGTEDEHMEFMREIFHEQASRHADEAVVDILFHVNSFTAEHLGEFLDWLKTDIEESTGRDVSFTVPESYLEDSDMYLDTMILEYLFIGSE